MQYQFQRGRKIIIFTNTSDLLLYHPYVPFDLVFNLKTERRFVTDFKVGYLKGFNTIRSLLKSTISLFLFRNIFIFCINLHKLVYLSPNKKILFIQDIKYKPYLMRILKHFQSYYLLDFGHTFPMIRHL